MPEITISLSAENMEKLRRIAIQLRVSPEELVRITVEEFLSRPDEDFEEIANYLLDKNAELYERLA